MLAAVREGRRVPCRLQPGDTTDATTILLAAAATALVLAGAADAKTFRFSTSGDVNGLDPHLNNETPTNAMKHNLYEGLVYRNHKLEVEPALATEWSQTGPTTWRFKLRQGVTFHDGTPFKADDVIFSIARAGATTSAMRIFTQTIKEVRKVDDHTIDIETKVPDPILLSSLGYLWIMSKDWSEKNGTATPVQGSSATRVTPTSTPTAPAPSRSSTGCRTRAPSWCPSTNGGASPSIT